jgi:hypothetical protein
VGGGGWVGLAGSSENKANLALLGLELGLSLVIKLTNSKIVYLAENIFWFLN